MAEGGRLQERVAIITGGASGIGQATAVRFAEEGAHIMVADLPAQSAGAAETLARVQALGRRGQFVAIDVTQEAQVDEMAEAAMTAFGRIDILVAAAGIEQDPRRPGHPPLLELPTASWQRLLDVNLTGVMLCNREVARRMIAGGRRGSIINLASGAARRTRPGLVTYSITKAGVWMLTRGLALELAPYGIRVNAIGPGIVASPMTHRLYGSPAGVEERGQTVPLGRVGQPLDIAHTAVFLASDESSFYTGSLLHPDGGSLISAMQ
jgi:NAD(P)-dependent dehydrogenase (short-subunit alcohol dehydrogenase family)